MKKKKIIKQEYYWKFKTTKKEKPFKKRGIKQVEKKSRK